MRALIAGILVVGGVSSACTQGARSGTARYSAEPSAPTPSPVAVRRNVPTWSTTSPSQLSQAPTVAPAPTPYAPRTVSTQPIVLSSRPYVQPAPARVVASTPAPVADSASGMGTPLPAPRARSASEIAARLRPINATCPVMLGSPVDPSVTTSVNGRVVAFADLPSRSKWLGDPDRYSRNLPGAGGFGSASDGPVFATSIPAAPPTPRVSAPLAAPKLPAFAMPPAPAQVPAATALRPAYAPAAVMAPIVPLNPVPVPAAVAAPAPAPIDADAGGTCTEGDCPGGNCKLPPRRK